PIALVRRDAYLDAGGFDETIREGHEDWDFWLRMAKAGYWGFTLREYLGWYRRRSSGRFQTFMRDQDAHERFAASIQRRFGSLRGHFPRPQHSVMSPYQVPETAQPFRNVLRKPEG